MKIRTFILLSMISPVLFAGAVKPRFEWDFEKVVKKGSKFAQNGLTISKISEKKGIASTDGMTCGKGLRAVKQINLKYNSFTVELKFKPESTTNRVEYLFSYAKHSYGRRQFSLLIDKRSCIGVNFSIRDIKNPKNIIKQYSAFGEAVKFEPGKWYTVRVCSTSGDELKIWLNGKLYKASGESLGFNDLNCELPKWWPLMAIGCNIKRGQCDNPFNGVIDDVKIWNCVVEPDILANIEGNVENRESPNILVKNTKSQPVIDGNLDEQCWKNAEWTYPFSVLDKETKVIGQFHKADNKFIKAAARSAVCYDNDKIYVAWKCPVPQGIEYKLRVKKTAVQFGVMIV